MKTSNITIDYFDNYMSYADTLKALRIKKNTLQDHMRAGKRFTEPGDTIILPNKKRVFHKDAVKREIESVLKENGVRNL